MPYMPGVYELSLQFHNSKNVAFGQVINMKFEATTRDEPQEGLTLASGNKEGAKKVLDSLNEDYKLQLYQQAMNLCDAGVGTFEECLADLAK